MRNKILLFLFGTGVITAGFLSVNHFLKQPSILRKDGDTIRCIAHANIVDGDISGFPDYGDLVYDGGYGGRGLYCYFDAVPNESVEHEQDIHDASLSDSDLIQLEKVVNIYRAVQMLDDIKLTQGYNELTNHYVVMHNNERVGCIAETEIRRGFVVNGISYGSITYDAENRMLHCVYRGLDLSKLPKIEAGKLTLANGENAVNQLFLIGQVYEQVEKFKY